MEKSHNKTQNAFFLHGKTTCGEKTSHGFADDPLQHPNTPALIPCILSSQKLKKPVATFFIVATGSLFVHQLSSALRLVVTLASWVQVSTCAA